MRALAGTLIAASVLGSAALVEAQAEDASAGEDSEYRRVLAQAVGEYDAGRYAEARAIFRRAHERSPNARTLRGIGMAGFEMREYAEALRALEGALTETRRPLTDEQRAHVQSLIERTRAYVARFEVSLSPEEAELFVDDAPARLDADGSLILDLGEHTLEARCSGCVTERRAVRVRGGEEQEIAFELAPVSAPEADVDPEPATVPPPAPPVSAPSESAGDGLTIVLLAGAGLCAAAAIGGVFWWLDRNGELDRCRNAGAACRNEETLEGERGVAAGATVGLAAAAIVLGMVGVLGMGGEEDDGAVACLVSPGGVGCAARF